MFKKYPIGILQGRLSPDVEKRFQFFPSDWEAELEYAKAYGFSGIEWLVDPKAYLGNPAMGSHFDFLSSTLTAEGADIPILSVCADWFMVEPLWNGSDYVLTNLRNVINSASFTKERRVLIPFLEKFTINNGAHWNEIYKILKLLSPFLRDKDVCIGFETELGAQEALDFLEGFESDRFGVYYDTGNATSYGFDCAEDIRALGSHIVGVHLKDRKRGSPQTVPLGEGDTDFGSVFTALKEVGFTGTPIMQAWRGENYLDDARHQLEYLSDIQKGIE